MKTIVSKFFSTALMFSVLGWTVSSCGDDDPKPSPVISAEAGTPQNVDLEAVVNLDGNASAGDGISYTWTGIAPDGNQLSLNDAQTSAASFRASMTGDYTLTLTIAIGDVEETDNVTVSVRNPTYAMADQMGRPAINTIFNYSSSKVNSTDPKDMYNTAYLPTNGAATYAAQFKGIFDALQSYIGLDPGAYRNIFSAVPGAEAFGTNTGLGQALSVDVLNCNKDFPTTYGPSDLSNPIPFANVLNGRKLEDDVIDVTLLLTFGGVFVDPNDPAQQNPLVAGLQTDFINANDVPFSDTFPYLAAPH